MRRVGVTRCTNIEKMLALYAPPSRKTGKAPAHSAPSKRKPDHERDPSSRVVQAPRTTQTHALYLAKSTPRNTVIDLTLSPSPPSCAHRRRHSSSPEIVVKSEPTTLSYLPKPAITSVDADADDRWARGQVFVLSGFGTWPAGVYAQDMVRAFGRISSGRASDSEVQSRFESAFPGVPGNGTTLQPFLAVQEVFGPRHGNPCRGIRHSMDAARIYVQSYIRLTQNLQYYAVLANAARFLDVCNCYY
ncbi:hypothetical protein B0H13DRAFT_2260966 [Mycena leptocephala]|nr:hypothetical protein B0H13DRAFT_2260966 [Mycena leptocephala]